MREEPIALYIFCFFNGFIISARLTWHFLILQTRSYEAICGRLPGMRFLHHKSITFTEYSQEEFPSEEKKELIFKEFLAWIPLYIHHFGSFTKASAKYWKILQLLQEELNLSLNVINQMNSHKEL